MNVSPRACALGPRAACALVGWCVLLSGASAFAQNVQHAQNAVDFKLRSDAHVDPMTLSLQFQIPLGNYPGRGGAGLPVTLYYSSRLWRVRHLATVMLGGQSRDFGTEPDSTYRAMYAESNASGWTSSLDWFLWPSANNIYFHGFEQPLEKYDDAGRLVSGAIYQRTVARMHAVLPDGSRHELRRADTVLTAGSDHATGTFYATDGSRLRYESATKTLHLPDGSRIVRETNADGGSLSTHYIDRNGNRNTYSHAAGLWTDTTGRTFSPPPLRDTAGDYAYQLPGAGGSPITYTFRWRHLSDVLQPGADGQPPPLRYKGDRTNARPHLPVSPSLYTTLDEQNSVTSDGALFNPVVLSQLVLPNGAAYTFKYNVWGEIARVDYPTGGFEKFTYGEVAPLGGQTDDGTYSQANRGVIQRVVSAPDTATGTAAWTYGSAIDTSVVPYRLMRRISAPDGSYTETLYHKSRQTDIKYGFDDARAGKPFDARAYAAPPDPHSPGPMLRRTLTDWTSTGPVPTDPHSTATRNARPTKIVELLFDTGGDALATTTTYQYDSDLNVISTSVYDFVSVDPSAAQTAAINAIPNGALLRTEETDYLTSDPVYRARNLLSLATATRIRNESGAVVAQSQASYDDAALLAYGGVANWSDPGTTARGNLTKTKRWLDTTGAWIESRIEYDQCGSPVKTTDERGNQSQVEYSHAYGHAYPTRTISAVPDPSGVFASSSALTTAITYDPSTGLVASITDANNQTTTYEYQDPLNRLTRVVRPAGGGSTTYRYGNSPGNISGTTYVEMLTSLDSTRTIYEAKFFDELGRPSRSFLHVGGWVHQTTDTEYDAMGRVWRVSNPYHTGGSTSAVNPRGRWTTTAYDALGRVGAVVTADGAAVTTSYSGNQLTVRDQAGRERLGIRDALGRLTRVVEDPAGLSHSTDYTYDALGNLRQVQQGSQQRFFLYDSLSRLVRARHPEQATGSVASNMTDAVTGNSQWSAAYGYDASGNLTARVDARNIKTSYAYDNLNRNTTISYSDAATPTALSYYDCAATANGRGRPCSVYTHLGGNYQTHTAIDSYNGAGLPLSQRQHFFADAAWSPAYAVGRTYDLAGNVLSQTYPSGRVVNYAYDAAGRPVGFSGNLGDGVARSYSSAITYDEQGGMKHEQFGTQTPLYHRRHYNVRGQLFDIRLSSDASNEWGGERGALVYYYGTNTAHGGSGPDNNGNVGIQQHHLGDGNYLHDSYTYDSLNRLTSVTEYRPGGVAQFAQAYEYDRYGNRTIKQASTWGPINRTAFTADPTTNRLGVPAGAAGTLGYDPAGNLVADTYTGRGLRAYDAENRMVSAHDNSNLISTYTYDAVGRRVKRQSAGQQVWQIYGMEGELLSEYAAQAAPASPRKEYGYRAGELLVAASAATPSPHALNNPGFETPNVGGGRFLYAPAGAAWAFTGGTGLSGNSSAFTSGNPVAPEGAQVAFLQGGSGSHFSQSVTGFQTGTSYTISFRAAQRGNGSHGGQDFDVYLDATLLGTFRPPGSVYAEMSTAVFTTTSGTHTLKFVGRNTAGGDNTAFIDDVRLAGTPANGADLRWLVSDRLGAPRLSVERSGARTGVRRHDYLPFGEELTAGVGGRTVQDGYAADHVRQKFTGYERDEETGLDYAQARYYASGQGRFTSPDPLLSSGQAAQPQTWNRYAYVLNNPLKFVDPLGLQTTAPRQNTPPPQIQVPRDVLDYPNSWTWINHETGEQVGTIELPQAGAAALSEDAAAIYRAAFEEQTSLMNDLKNGIVLSATVQEQTSASTNVGETSGQSAELSKQGPKLGMTQGQNSGATVSGGSIVTRSVDGAGRAEQRALDRATTITGANAINVLTGMKVVVNFEDHGQALQLTREQARKMRQETADYARIRAIQDVNESFRPLNR
jgi:RHS repeat-associated protein